MDAMLMVTMMIDNGMFTLRDDVKCAETAYSGIVKIEALPDP
jgi:hypothetical protein